MPDKLISRRSFLTVSAMAAAAVAMDWNNISAYAAKMGPKSEYPTVVIGAGLGGLVCGAYLARQGIPVTVVEQHSIPGGYATSFDRAGGKFNFEVSLHGTSIHNNGAARILSDIGVLDKIKLVQLPEVYRLKVAKLDISVPQKDPQAYIAGNKTEYEKEKNRWTNILIQRAEEKVIPGLSAMVEVKDAASPLTNWSYTGNPEGAIYGFEQSMDNAYMNRIKNKTPVKGLYLASAWGDPGGGYGGVFRGGQGAFVAMMKDWGG